MWPSESFLNILKLGKNKLYSRVFLLRSKIIPAIKILKLWTLKSSWHKKMRMSALSMSRHCSKRVDCRLVYLWWAFLHQLYESSYTWRPTIWGGTQLDSQNRRETSKTGQPDNNHNNIPTLFIRYINGSKLKILWLL